MITDISALKAHTIRMGEKLPALESEIVLKSPGIGQSDCARLKSSILNLPESYLKCVQSLNVNGVLIGYFHLWPRGTKNVDLVDGLVKINSPENNPLWNFLKESGLFEVAAWEAEPICVASNKSTYEEGTILKISIAQPFPKVELLAQNFEAFLLIAGNLDAIRDEYSRSGNMGEARAKFDLCLTRFGLPNEALATWKNIGSVVLSDSVGHPVWRRLNR